MHMMCIYTFGGNEAVSRKHSMFRIIKIDATKLYQPLRTETNEYLHSILRGLLRKRMHSLNS